MANGVLRTSHAACGGINGQSRRFHRARTWHDHLRVSIDEEQHVALNSAVVRPDAEAWTALPKRAGARREALFAWLLGVLTTAGAFIADRGWETLDDPAWTGAYRIIDMYGMASILLAVVFSLVGLLLRRYALVAAPLVLSAAAVPHSLDGYASAPVWGFGAALATVPAVMAAAESWRQMRAVQRLAQKSLTARTASIGPNAVQAANRVLRHGLLKTLLFLAAACAGWALALGALPGELGRTSEELGEASASSAFAAAAIAASIMAVAEVFRQVWRLFAMSRVGRRLIWEIPSGPGMMSLWPFSMGNDTGQVPMEAAQAPGCVCLAEFRRAWPEAEDELVRDEGVPASDYCPLHGIDRINELTVKEFAARTEEPWVWDAASDFPEPANPDAKRLLLYGFAGRAFGGIPVRKRTGCIDADFPEIAPASEDAPGAFIPSWDKAERPEYGVLDVIDLRPAGYGGVAFRYQHGRAWFEAERTLETDII
jgi:hypothetical protein